MIIDALVWFGRMLNNALDALFKSIDYTVNHLFMPRHIRARHYMCCKKYLRDGDYGKQTVW